MPYMVVTLLVCQSPIGWLNASVTANMFCKVVTLLDCQPPIGWLNALA